MEISKPKVKLKNDFIIRAFFDTRAEINIMIRKVLENAGLVKRQRLKLEFILYTGYSQFFLDFCKDVKILIGCLKTKHLLFIVEHRDNNLVFV